MAVHGNKVLELLTLCGLVSVRVKGQKKDTLFKSVHCSVVSRGTVSCMSGFFVVNFTSPQYCSVNRAHRKLLFSMCPSIKHI